MNTPLLRSAFDGRIELSPFGTAKRVDPRVRARVFLAMAAANAGLWILAALGARALFA